MFLGCRLFNDSSLDCTIHSLFRLNTEKAIYLLIHEVVLINNVLRDQAECDLLVLIIRHWVVEVEVLDVKH